MTYANRGSRARRWLRWGIGYAAAVLLVTGIGLVIVAAVGPQPRENLNPPPAPSPPWASTKPPVRAPSSPPGLAGPVHVVQGRELIDGVYLGYPHSTVGAISAADEFWTQIGSTLDPDRAAAVMRMTADPSYADGPEQAAQGAVNDRKSLGLPVSGPVPQGASLALDPVEYEVRDVSADQVTVLLLSDLVSTVPTQGTQTEIGVFPFRMHWAEADWKILPPDNASYSSLTAEPGSPQAAAAGWQDLEPAGS